MTERSPAATIPRPEHEPPTRGAEAEDWLGELNASLDGSVEGLRPAASPPASGETPEGTSSIGMSEFEKDLARPGVGETAPDGESEAESNSHYYEHELVRRLDNPELTGMRAFRQGVSTLAVQTIEKVEKVVYVQQDVVSYVKGKRLQAKYNKEEKKLDKWSRKAEKRYLLFRKHRREKFAERAEAQKKVVERKKRHLVRHEKGVQQRLKERDEVFEGRRNALNEREQIHLKRKQLATYRKMKRRERRLERAEKYLPVDEETKQMLRARRQILLGSTIFSMLLGETEAKKKADGKRKKKRTKTWEL